MINEKSKKERQAEMKDSFAGFKGKDVFLGDR